MTLKKNKPGIVIVSKDFAFWTKIVTNLKSEIEASEKDLKYNRACLVMSEGELKNAS